MKENVLHNVGVYSVGVYSRLSELDKKNQQANFSDSIENQKAILEKFVEEKGWSVYGHYVDDDISGTTFDRDGFERMVEDIKAGLINCVVVKDLSRFGRNYLASGMLRETFDELGVRFIAVGDNHDSIEDTGVITVFKEVMNEEYAKDISRKVRMTKKHLGSEGKFCNSRAPYGYWKSTADKHILVIDSDVSQNVVRVFDLYIAGMTARAIADLFNDEGIITPNQYYYKKVDKPNPYINNKNLWGSASVMNIINNRVYYGAITNGKRAVKSFKDKRRIQKPENEWVIIDNKHEPLINKERWEEAQSVTSKKKHFKARRTASGEVSIFAGLIRCADCDGNLVYQRKELKTQIQEFFRCSTYAQKGKNGCSIHKVDYQTIYQAVLADIKRYAKLAAEDEQKLIDRILKDNEEFKAKNVSRSERNIRESRNKITEIDRKVQLLFEQKISGEIEISGAMFNKMVNNYESEQQKLSKDIEELESEQAECKRVDKNLTGWIKKVRNCLSIESITRAIAVELIEKIVVSEQYEESGEQYIDISIFYKFGIQKQSHKT